MIRIIGGEGSELLAGKAVQKAIVELWPDVLNSSSSEDDIIISVSTKLSGYEVSDIDVVVCGILKSGRKFIPNKVLKNQNGERLMRTPITVSNFLIAIEVKDHSETGVKFSGDNISVRYKNTGWKSATDQNVKQVHSIAQYFKHQNLKIYVHRCVVMQGLYQISVSGAVASGFTGKDFFSSIASVSSVRQVGRDYIFSSAQNHEIRAALTSSIFKVILPTSLDRKRMDMITAKSNQVDELLNHVGKKMIRLRGHGGSGKTVMLIQMAWKAYQERGTRTLLLTYNIALAADIMRLLTLMRIPTDPEVGGIVVKSVMSFMLSWFRRLQFIEDDDEVNLQLYNEHCNTVLDMMRQGAISLDDVQNIISSDPDKYEFDYVAVDESQDWPPGEAGLLKHIYSAEKIVLADGVDQLLRGDKLDWETDVPPEKILLISLKCCLRMKKNLSVFTNTVANEGEVNWNVIPNDKAGGGRVIILKRDYSEYPSLHNELIDSAIEKGNAPLDFLFCVPSDNVIRSENNTSSKLGVSLRERGSEIWDGVDEVTRKDFPRSTNQLRVVQYASVRGLEGWTVVLEHADKYWEEMRRIKLDRGLTSNEALALEDIENLSKRDAWTKLLISLTRPIDTLVITIDDVDSEFSRAIFKVAERHCEFIEVYN